VSGSAINVCHGPVVKQNLTGCIERHPPVDGMWNGLLCAGKNKYGPGTIHLRLSAGCPAGLARFRVTSFGTVTLKRARPAGHPAERRRWIVPGPYLFLPAHSSPFHIPSTGGWRSMQPVRFCFTTGPWHTLIALPL